MRPVHCYVQLLQILLHEGHYSGPLKIAIYNEYSSKIVPSINTTKNGFKFLHNTFECLKKLYEGLNLSHKKPVN